MSSFHYLLSPRITSDHSYTLPGVRTSILTVINMTVEAIGTYICQAENGVKPLAKIQVNVLNVLRRLQLRTTLLLLPRNTEKSRLCYNRKIHDFIFRSSPFTMHRWCHPVKRHLLIRKSNRLLCHRWTRSNQESILPTHPISETTRLIWIWLDKAIAQPWHRWKLRCLRPNRERAGFGGKSGLSLVSPSS